MEPRSETAVEVALDNGALLPHQRRITSELYSGGAPQNRAAFALLASQGIKTVVSVDGTRPDLDAARRYGLRYVHIPIGYGEIDAHALLSIAQLVRSAETPFYIHCHRGLHRAPAVAAIASMAAGVFHSGDAIEILESAGTSEDYPGLWRSVTKYQHPSEDCELPPLLEVAPIDTLKQGMAHISRLHQELRDYLDASDNTDGASPNAKAIENANLIAESFREMRRQHVSGDGAGFDEALKSSESIAWTLRDALSDQDPSRVTKTVRMLTQSCVDCHRKHRD